jgi:multidrug efflux pump
VGLAKSAAGEYTFSIFAVVFIALIVSWVVAVLFIPYMGFHLLPDYSKQGHGPGLLARIGARMFPRLAAAQHAGGHAPEDVYSRPFYRGFRALVTWCVVHRKTVIVGTIGLFLLSVVGFKFVQQQFFPSADRPELVVDLWLQNGSAIGATDSEARRFEAILAKDPDVEKYVAYVGGGSPRFYLPLDQQLDNANLAEFVVTAKSTEVRDRLQGRLEELLETQFSRVRARVQPLQNGPPVPYPVAFRVSGVDFDELRRIGNEMALAMRGHPNMRLVHLDWNEKSKVVKLEIDQNKARLVGVTSAGLSNMLNSVLTGFRITEFRERDKLIEVLARAEAGERRSLADLGDINVPTQSGRWVPLSHVARINYVFEDGLIWRRSRVPTITVQGDVIGSVQPPEVSDALEPAMRAIAAKLPAGYKIETGGAIEESARGQGSVNAVLPLMLVTVVTLLMVHLQNIRKTFLVLVTAPLGIIGVCLFLLVGRVPFGFVAMLGFIALSGMIMRNSIILVDQIDQDISDGHHPWHAVIEATVRRFRPIILTAAAAILAMIPLSRSNFWGPMAVAIMGGLLVATVLTLLFLPALYAAVFRVRRPAAT